MKIKLDAVLTTMLVVCALITTGVLVRREFATPPSPASRTAQTPVPIKDWESHVAKGVRMGPVEAPVQVLEFSDFECPFCATFHKHLSALRQRYPGRIGLTYIHFPLPMHRFAEPAARVAECAGEQGRFEAMHDVLFERQQEFGLKPWSEFATEAGVPDGAVFEACIKRTEPLQRVTEGKALGQRLNVKGTPTVIINGWKLTRPPSAEELEDMIKAILAGKNPVRT